MLPPAPAQRGRRPRRADAMAEKRVSRWYFGGLASCAAACCTHPLDLIKVCRRGACGESAGGTLWVGGGGSGLPRVHRPAARPPPPSCQALRFAVWRATQPPGVSPSFRLREWTVGWRPRSPFAAGCLAKAVSKGAWADEPPTQPASHLPFISRADKLTRQASLERGCGSVSPVTWRGREKCPLGLPSPLAAMLALFLLGKACQVPTGRAFLQTSAQKPPVAQARD